MFTAAELADLRATQQAAMPYACTVTTYGPETTTADGGTNAGTPTVAATVCRVGAPSAADQRIAEAARQTVDTAVTLPYGANVTSRSEIAVAATGRTYAVAWVNTEQSDQAAVRAVCRTIRGGA